MSFILKVLENIDKKKVYFATRVFKVRVSAPCAYSFMLAALCELHKFLTDPRVNDYLLANTMNHSLTIIDYSNHTMILTTIKRVNRGLFLSLVLNFNRSIPRLVVFIITPPYR